MYSLKSGRPVEEAVALIALGPGATAEPESTVDLYLQPPGEDAETCANYIRMRLRAGRYTLHFEETLVDGELLISPAISFDVPVRTLSGLLSLGYTLGASARGRD